MPIPLSGLALNLDQLPVGERLQVDFGGFTANFQPGELPEAAREFAEQHGCSMSIDDNKITFEKIRG
jgi:hypothetical protein